MRSSFDKVHTLGMSSGGSTHLTVSEFSGNKVEPPINVVFEDDGMQVAVTQDALAARYRSDELQQIGEGNAIMGLNRVIGEIATNGNLEHGATKPLHPNVIDVEAAAYAELPVAQKVLTA